LKRKFLALLHEGQQKAYRIPLKDRPPQTLNFGKQTYSDSIHHAIRKGQLSGDVAFSVEFKDDGIVGDVRIVKGLVPDLDASVLRAIRESVFLPAVENGAFVTSWRTSVAEFSNEHK
jgi:Gram-negative bacterial TonB protein C-terminal